MKKSVSAFAALFTAGVVLAGTGMAIENSKATNVMTGAAAVSPTQINQYDKSSVELHILMDSNATKQEGTKSQSQSATTMDLLPYYANPDMGIVAGVGVAKINTKTKEEAKDTTSTNDQLVLSPQVAWTAPMGVTAALAIDNVSGAIKNEGMDDLKYGFNRINIAGTHDFGNGEAGLTYRTGGEFKVKNDDTEDTAYRAPQIVANTRWEINSGFYVSGALTYSMYDATSDELAGDRFYKDNEKITTADKTSFQVAAEYEVASRTKLDTIISRSGAADYDFTHGTYYVNTTGLEVNVTSEVVDNINVGGLVSYYTGDRSYDYGEGKNAAKYKLENTGTTFGAFAGAKF